MSEKLIYTSNQIKSENKVMCETHSKLETLLKGDQCVFTQQIKLFELDLLSRHFPFLLKKDYLPFVRKIGVNTRVTLNIKNPRITISYHNLKIYQDIFIIQAEAHKNTLNWLLTSPYNIDKIFCKNQSNLFLIQNSGNCKADFS